ncbi:MAG TPA: hypothetical protein PLN64_01625 [Candidatus Bipolaricaulis anaerobius]|nr:hypothetical protein [Candidatus Bipolaricaulis anaerobius]
METVTPYTVRLEPGDIVLTRSSSWLSHLICLFTRTVGEPPSRVSHSELVADPGTVTTAAVISADREGAVLRTILPHHEGNWVEIYRPILSDAWKRRAVARAGWMLGSKYPVWRLLAHLADWLLGLGLVDLYLFRRAFRSGRVMECSYLVAYAYEPYLAFWKPTPAITPDDLEDGCRRGERFRLVLPLTRLERREP